MKNKPFFYLSVFLSLGSFLLCYFFIAFHNRFATDDYYFLSLVRSKGVFDAVSYFYFNWEGAYFGFFYNFLIADLIHYFSTPFIYNFLIVFTFFTVLLILIRKAGVFLFGISDISFTFTLTVAITSDLYYNDLAIADVWYWMIGGVYLIFPLVFVCLIYYIHVNSENKFKWYIFPFTFLLMAVRLNFSAVFLSLLFIIILYNSFEKYKNKNNVILFIVSLIGLLIYIIAPGNYIRHSNFDSKISYDLASIAINVFHLTIDYIQQYVIYKLHYHIIFLLPAIYLGYYFRDNILICFKNMKLTKNIFFLAIILIVEILAQSLIMYLAKGAQTKRTLTFVNITFVLFEAYIFLIIGAYYTKSKFLAFFVFLSGIFLSISLNLRRFTLNKKLVQEYSLAVDNQIYHIKKANEDYQIVPFDTLFLPKIPTSGWLPDACIGKLSDSKNVFNNNYLKMYYNTKFVIDLKKDDN